MAAYAGALATQDAAELRERVDRAASLLERSGNTYHLADLLAGATYAALTMGSDGDARAFVARAMPLAEELDTPFLWMLVRGNSALAALMIGDIDGAQNGFREELKLCRELTAVPFAHEGLQGLAAVAAAHDDVERAARLSGASEAHRYDQPEDPVDARIVASFFEPARSRCGLDVWDAARSRRGHSEP